MHLGKVVIQMINTSSKILEAELKTYKACKSPRHEEGTEPDARIMKKHKRRVQ